MPVQPLEDFGTSEGISGWTNGYAISFIQYSSWTWYYAASAPSSDSCFASTTGVLMADGTTRPTASVKEGDRVQTPDGPRRVEFIATPPRHGRSLFSIRGIDARFTASHPILAAEASGMGYAAIDPRLLATFLRAGKTLFGHGLIALPCAPYGGYHPFEVMLADQTGRSAESAGTCGASRERCGTKNASPAMAGRLIARRRLPTAWVMSWGGHWFRVSPNGLCMSAAGCERSAADSSDDGRHGGRQRSSTVPPRRGLPAFVNEGNPALTRGELRIDRGFNLATGPSEPWRETPNQRFTF